MKMIVKFIRRILEMLFNLILGWLIGLIELILAQAAKARQRKRLSEQGDVSPQCQVVPPTVYKRPDPLIYDQYYLMSLGLAVTWDNPDIQLYEGGVPVSSDDLKPDTVYTVQATIYNGSTEAPAVGMPVDFSYLSFGIGTVSTPIGTTTVDLPVRGAPGHPATAAMNWRTPATPGHYCIQVKLIWADDANPNNNLGQENTNVGAAHSPAVFEFPVHNGNVIPEVIRLEADAYTILPPVDCSQLTDGERDKRDNVGRKNLTEEQRAELKQRQCEALAQRHKRGTVGVPAGWSVVIDPDRFDLQPDATQMVKVTITPPDGFTTGTQAFNINAFNRQEQMLGGVTLYVIK